MAIKKTRFKPPVYVNGTATYPDTVYTETSADMVKITDAGGQFTGENVEAALQEVASELDTLTTETSKKAYGVEVEKLSNTIINLAESTKSVIPDVKVSTYSRVSSLSANVREGQMNVKVSGNTLKNEANYNKNTWAEWVNYGGGLTPTKNASGMEFTADGSNFGSYKLLTVFKPSTKYGALCYINGTFTANKVKFDPNNVLNALALFVVGNNKKVFTTSATISTNMLQLAYDADTSGKTSKFVDIRVFELPTSSQIETDFNTLTADQLAEKYPHINGNEIKSVVAGAVKTTGKNLFDKFRFSYIGGRFGGGTLTDSITSDLAYNVSDYIRIKSNTNYLKTNFASWVYFYDINKSLISGVALDLFTTPVNAYYIRTSVAIMNLNTAQIEEGTVATTYEPYTETVRYLPNTKLRALPNGVKDYVDGDRHVKNVQDYILQSSDIVSIDAITFSGVVVLASVPMSKLIGAKSITTSYSDNGQFTVDGKTPATNAGVTESIGKYYTSIANGLMFVLPPNTTLVQAQTALAGTKIFYQLATPVITELLPNTLKSSPKGSVQYGNIRGEVGFYASNCIVSDTTVPIKAITKLYKVDKLTGSETALPISLAVIAGDKLSFTHPSLVAVDLVDWDYEFDSALSTTPLIEYEYGNGYNGNVVIGTTTFVIKNGIITNVTTA